MTKTMREGWINPFLEKRISESQAKSSQFAVFLVDIDNFKRVNDHYNHEIGNMTLTELADVIRPRSKGEEIFRYGGDEFLIVTNLGMDERTCWGYAGRIVREVASHDFLGEINSPDRIKLTVSCGSVLVHGNVTVAEIRKCVVEALKMAKQPNEKSPSGKNCAFQYAMRGEPIVPPNTHSPSAQGVGGR